MTQVVVSEGDREEFQLSCACMIGDGAERATRRGWVRKELQTQRA